jgi:hypothetical protein
LFSNFAFNCNLRRYNKMRNRMRLVGAVRNVEVGWCKLTPSKA